MDFYRRAERILERVLAHKASIKTEVLAKDVGTDPDRKRMFAVIHQVLQYREPLLELIESAGIRKAEKKTSEPMLLLLVHDHLFGKGVQCGGPLKQIIVRHKTRLQGELVKLKVRRKAKRNEDLIPAVLRKSVERAALMPRYVRVNLVKSTVKEVIAWFNKYKPEWTVRQDEHLSDLLLLPAGTPLFDNELYLGGKIILQDKASCFPAHALLEGYDVSAKGIKAIDACAAPGNKTSHLSSLLGNRGQINAYDLDARRLQTLHMLTKRAGCTNINAVNASFLDVRPEQHAYVELILLDPSCSGSGIISRLDQLVDNQQRVGEHDEADGKDMNASDRLQALADFQVQMIEHAMKFPGVQRISYSTCSIHPEENEHVVARVLSKAANLWSVRPTLQEWPRRGIAAEVQRGMTAISASDKLAYADAIANALVRCDPELDACNGFFVAVFERR